MGRRRAGHVRKKKRVRRKHTRYVQLVRVQHHTSRRRQPGTAGSSASKSGKNENTVLALFSHGCLPYSVVSDSKLLETSRGLGTGGPAARANPSRPAARERGRKYGTPARFSVYKAKKTLSLDPILVAYYDSDLNKVL
jgi:hypothetical protein